MRKVEFTLSKRLVGNDYRPNKFPLKYPYWCVKEDAERFHMVSYGDSGAEVKKLWPNGDNFKIGEDVVIISYTDELPKPDWYDESNEEYKTAKSLEELTLDTDLIDLVVVLRKHMKSGNTDFVSVAMSELKDSNKYKSYENPAIIKLINEKMGSFYVKFVEYLEKTKA